MTRSAGGILEDFDPEIERTFRARRNQLSVSEAFDLSLTQSIPDYSVDQMADHQKTMKELAAPDDAFQYSCIAYPELTGDFELRSGIIHLLPKFQGQSGEDPNRHLHEFHVVCSTMKPQGISEEDIKLRAFPFSLTGAAKDWFYYLPTGHVSSWISMKKAFLEKYFPASRTAVIRKSICGIQQVVGETLYDYWERFNKLCSSCPQHQISEQLLIQYFYEGLLQMDRIMIDAAAGGALVNKTPDQARELISNMAENSQQFGSRALSTRGINEVQMVSNEQKEIKSTLMELTSLVKQMTLNNVSQNQNFSVPPPSNPVMRLCSICSSQDHNSDLCPNLQQDETLAALTRGQFQAKNNPYSSTYNPGWRDHPNLKYGNSFYQQNPSQPQYQQPQQNFQQTSQQFQPQFQPYPYQQGQQGFQSSQTFQPQNQQNFQPSQPYNPSFQPTQIQSSPQNFPFQNQIFQGYNSQQGFQAFQPSYQPYQQAFQPSYQPQQPYVQNFQQPTSCFQGQPRNYANQGSYGGSSGGNAQQMLEMLQQVLQQQQQRTEPAIQNLERQMGQLASGLNQGQAQESSHSPSQATLDLKGYDNTPTWRNEEVVSSLNTPNAEFPEKFPADHLPTQTNSGGDFTSVQGDSSAWPSPSSIDLANWVEEEEENIEIRAPTAVSFDIVGGDLCTDMVENAIVTEALEEMDGKACDSLKFVSEAPQDSSHLLFCDNIVIDGPNFSNMAVVDMVDKACIGDDSTGVGDCTEPQGPPTSKDTLEDSEYQYESVGTCMVEARAQESPFSVEYPPEPEPEVEHLHDQEETTVKSTLVEPPGILQHDQVSIPPISFEKSIEVPRTDFVGCDALIDTSFVEFEFEQSLEVPSAEFVERKACCDTFHVNADCEKFLDVSKINFVHCDEFIDTFSVEIVCEKPVEAPRIDSIGCDECLDASHVDINCEKFAEIPMVDFIGCNALLDISLVVNNGENFIEATKIDFVGCDSLLDTSYIETEAACSEKLIEVPKIDFIGYDEFLDVSFVDNNCDKFIEVPKIDFIGCDAYLDSFYVEVVYISFLSYPACAREVFLLYDLAGSRRLLEWVLKLNSLQPPGRTSKEHVVGGVEFTLNFKCLPQEWILNLNRLRPPEDACAKLIRENSIHYEVDHMRIILPSWMLRALYPT